MRKLYAALATLVLGSSLLCQEAVAGGALSFLSTAVTVHSGEPNSWMNVYSDCPGSPIACNTGAGGVALPTQTAPVDVTTQLTGGELILRFSIPDKTSVKEGPSSLTVGDTIVVQLDPDASRGPTLGMGGTAVTTDYRYEIKIVDSQLLRVRRREPSSGTTWGLGTTWCSGLVTPLPQVCSNANGTVTLSAVAPAYVVELKVPLASIGSPNKDFGLAIGIFNDLGHDDGSGTPNLSAVTFPFGDMPADTENPILDPGVTDTVQGGGAWVRPASWGTGFVAAPAGNPNQLTLGHNPQPWVADAIKLSFCDTGRFEDIGTADTSLNQTNLANWYLYERDDPCKMGVWVRVNNSSTTITASARLLVMWADGGLATNTWRVVALTPAISFGPGASTFRVVWDKVPSKGSVPGGSTHPCLRVYLLPATLNQSDPTSGHLYNAAGIQSISNETKLAEFERAYAFPPYPWNSQVAQMNFTNIANRPAPVECSRLPNCKQPMIVMNEFQQFLLASLDSLGPRPAYAQPPSDRLVATPVNTSERHDWPKPKYPMVIVSVQGFTVPEKVSKRPYIFVQNIGGVAWAMDETAIDGKSVNLGFTMTVPAIIYRDLSSKKVKEIRALPRRIMLFGKASGREGDKRVDLKFEAYNKAMEPGKPRRANVTVSGQ